MPGYGAPRNRIDATVDQQFAADVDGGGRFELFRFGLGGQVEAPVSRAFGLGLRGGYIYSGFDFRERPVPGCPGNLPCFELSPWKSIHTVDVAPSAALRFSDAVQLIASVPIRWDAEAGSNQNGMTAGILGAVRFAPSDRFAAGVGIGVQSEIEQDASVFPVVSLDWRIRDDLHLSSTGGPEQGGGGRLRWSPSEVVSATFEAGWERRRFRTNRHGSRNPSGVAEYRAVPLQAGIEVRLTRSLRVEFHSGVAVAGRLQWDGPSGGALIEQDFDAAALVGGSLRALF